MHEFTLFKQENIKTTLKKESSFSFVRTTMLLGFIFRWVVFLMIVNRVFADIDPYFVVDDWKYETLAKTFAKYSKGPLDFDYFDYLTIGFAEQFWPWVMCFSTKLFNYAYIGRIINIFISTFTIWVIYKLTFEISENIKTALLAARLFAFMPLPVLTCCFPIKDIFLTFTVMYAFYIFVCLQKGNKVSPFRLVLCGALLICTFFTRGAIVELLMIFLAVYFAQKLIGEQKYIQLVAFSFVVLVLILVFKDRVAASFQTKVDDYGGYAELGNGIRYIKVTGLKDIYKLPLAYGFATLQPITLDYIDGAKVSWSSVVAVSNITMYPIAMGNFVYMFEKKKNLFFWLSSFIMYSAVIILSLGIYRHYLFLLPVQMINFSLFVEIDKKQNLTISFIGALALFLIILAATAFNVF